MNQRAWVRNAAAVFLSSSVALVGVSAFAAEPASNIYQGYTIPSEQRGLNFNAPGVVSKVNVKEGDLVKKGQLLVEQDKTVEDAELEILRIDAESDLQIDAAKKELAEKKAEHEQNQLQLSKKVIGAFEVLRSKLEVDVSEARLFLAVQTKSQDSLKAEKVRKQIIQKQLFATTDGIVQAINIHEGELSSNDPKTPVISVVTNDPIYVEVDLPISEARHLKLHQKVPVQYEDDSNWQTAEIILVSPVANAMAHSQKVRLQLANPENLSAGLGVSVKLVEKVAAAASAR
jgi:multidrug efflux pump subunit AcrA (membrane-fusion protein)